MDFKIVKKGYDTKSVDEYIKNITADYEERLSLQKERIFALKDELEKSTSNTAVSEDDMLLSLYEAIKRAEMVENSSKNLFDLEAKRLSLTYIKMESMLSRPSENIFALRQQLLSMIKKCRNTLEQNVLEQKERFIAESKSIKSFANIVSSDKDLQNDKLNEDEEKNEVVLHIKKNSKNDESDYSPNESGFDLREAINPTEDLDEIMKAFDFYNDNKR